MSDIERVKEALNIVDVVGSYVELKNAGTNLKGNCPFHNEKTPSFMVNPSLQIFKCFGCGKGGDAIKFLQEIERLTFPEALQKGADIAGIELAKSFSAKDKAIEEKKKRYIQAYDLASKFYHHILTKHKSGEEGRAYARKRGIPKEIIKEFLVGYAPNNKENLKKFLINKGFSEQELIEFGLLVIKENKSIDKFRHRLLNPIFNNSHTVVAFSGRYIGDFKEAPKYLNSSETLLYKKNQLLFGLSHAIRRNHLLEYIILVEGNLDVLACHKAGYTSVVAPLGTAFTDQQAQLLKRYTKTLYFAFDSDKAGISALIRSIGIAERFGLEHRFIDVRPYKDIDELITQDPKILSDRIEKNVHTVEFLISYYLEGIDAGSINGKTEFKKNILPILSLLIDEVERNHFANQIALILGIRSDQVLQLLEKKNKISSIIVEPETEENNQEIAFSLYEQLTGYLYHLLQHDPKFEYSVSLQLEPIVHNAISILLETKGQINKEIISMLDKHTAKFLSESIQKAAAIEMNVESTLFMVKKLTLELLEKQYGDLQRKLLTNANDEELLADLQEYIVQKKQVERL